MLGCYRVTRFDEGRGSYQDYWVIKDMRVIRVIRVIRNSRVITAACLSVSRGYLGSFRVIRVVRGIRVIRVSRVTTACLLVSLGLRPGLILR